MTCLESHSQQAREGEDSSWPSDQHAYVGVVTQLKQCLAGVRQQEIF